MCFTTGKACTWQRTVRTAAVTRVRFVCQLGCTSGTQYQQGCPRRVMELSMMSSATRKKACNCGTPPLSVAILLPVSFHRDIPQPLMRVLV